MPFANNDGVRIHYEVDGSGPPILFQHGFTGTLNDWRVFGFVRALSQDYRCIFLSGRGRGESDKPHDPKAYVFQNKVRDMVAVLDDLKIEKAHYFGYSMGGVIGFRIPLYAPDRFRSLILGGSEVVSRDMARDDLSPAFTAMEQAVDAGRSDATDVLVSSMESAMGPMAPERRASVLAQDARALVADRRSRKEEPNHLSADYLSHIKLPCLIYSGEADPRCDDARQTARQIPGAQFFSLPGLNHLQAYSRSDLVVPYVRKFLGAMR